MIEQSDRHRARRGSRCRGVDQKVERCLGIALRVDLDTSAVHPQRSGTGTLESSASVEQDDIGVVMVEHDIGVGAILDMAWPRTPDVPWFLNYANGLIWLAIVGIGALYMLVARPYDAGTAPAGDAWKLAKG